MDGKVGLFFYLHLAVASVGGFLGGLLGGWDIMLEVLVTMVVADYCTGIVKALLRRSDKSAEGGLASSVMFSGGLRKALIFAVVAIACVADKIIAPGSTVLRSGAIVYYIGTEGLSIIENVALCGVPIPGKLRDMLESLRNPKGDGKETRGGTDKDD